MGIRIILVNEIADREQESGGKNTNIQQQWTFLLNGFPFNLFIQMHWLHKYQCDCFIQNCNGYKNLLQLLQIIYIISILFFKPLFSPSKKLFAEIKFHISREAFFCCFFDIRGRLPTHKYTLATIFAKWDFQRAQTKKKHQFTVLFTFHQYIQYKWNTHFT